MVSTLSDSGPGSLVECLEAAVARVCVFEVGGEIRLRRDVVVRNPYITIAGQTAPSPGITIRGAGIRIATHDVIVQHIRIRVGADPLSKTDGICVAVRGENHGSVDTSKILVDHVSLSWAWNKLFDTWSRGIRDVTLSNSILSEALHRSVHPSGRHSTAILIGPHSERVSIHSNVLLHANHRHPYLKGGSSTLFANNVIYNPGWRMAQLEDGEGHGLIRASLIKNQLINGPDTPAGIPLLRVDGSVRSSSIYIQGNVIGVGAKARPIESVETVDGGVASLARTPPFPLPRLLLRDERALVTQLAGIVGARPWDRDAVDDRVIGEMLIGGGRRRDCVSDELTRGCIVVAPSGAKLQVSRRALTLPVNPNGDDDGDGYTNLEEWISTFERR